MMQRVTLLCALVLAACGQNDEGRPQRTSKYHYIPGMQLVDYTDKGYVRVLVNSLHSHDALVPFDFYSMPYCEPPSDDLQQEDENLGQLLWGDKIETSLYGMKMRENVQCKVLSGSPDCPNGAKILTPADLELFDKRINNGYRGNFVIDNLPVIGVKGGRMINNNPKPECTDMAPRGWPLGVQKECTKHMDTTFINTHLKFRITVNEHMPGQWIIVRVNVEPFSTDIENPEDCAADKPFNPSAFKPVTTEPGPGGAGKKVTWTYAVEWVETKEVGWEDRWDAYLSLAYTNTNSRAHWMNILNSLLVILCLSAIVAMILLRALHLDFNRYNNPESQDEQQEEMGWKLVHGDVFRPPPAAPLFSAIVGTGSQLIGMLLVVLLFAMLGFLSPSNRGALLRAALLMFVCMSVCNGFIVGGLLKMFQLRQWKYVTLSAVLYPGVIFLLWITREVVVLANRPRANTAAMLTILKMMGLWLGFSIPLVILGAAFTFNMPALEGACRVTKLARKIPVQRWYLEHWALFLLPGIIPFGAAFAELRFIMFSMWQGLVYYVFGFLAITVLAVSITSAELAVVGVYFSLCFEDYRWWWKSLIVPGGLGVWFFLYSIAYYHRMLTIKTWLATFMYFQTMFMASVSLWIMAATVGFFASYLFVYVIYRNVKLD